MYCQTIFHKNCTPTGVVWVFLLLKSSFWRHLALSDILKFVKSGRGKMTFWFQFLPLIMNETGHLFIFFFISLSYFLKFQFMFFGIFFFIGVLYKFLITTFYYFYCKYSLPLCDLWPVWAFSALLLHSICLLVYLCPISILACLTMLLIVSSAEQKAQILV